MKKLFTTYVIAFMVVSGFQCSSSTDAPAIFVSMIGAKQWTNVADANNTFFFIVKDSTNTSTFNGNENLPSGKQASFTGALNNHDIQFTYDNNTDTSRANKTYKGTVNDASNVMTLKGADATNPLPAVTLNAQ